MTGIFDKEAPLTPKPTPAKNEEPSSLNLEDSEESYSKNAEFEIELEPFINPTDGEQPASSITEIAPQQLSQAAEDPTEDEQLVLFEDELNLRGKVEAILFAAPTPLKASEIFELIQEEGINIRDILEVTESLQRFYQEKGGGFKLTHQKGKGYQFQTVTTASYLMERLFSQRPRPLSRAAHETLAIIAYRQPVTRADIEFIRGVDAGSIIKNLLERNLIQCVGRKEDSPGKPMVFGTSTEFLKTYRLKSLESLPPLDSFQPAQDVMEQALEKIDAKQEIDVEALITQKPDGIHKPVSSSANEEVEK
ncbi:MAG: SMC-Scp complex subunit ScpB [Oligoflexales bacterium]